MKSHSLLSGAPGLKVLFWVTNVCGAVALAILIPLIVLEGTILIPLIVLEGTDSGSDQTRQALFRVFQLAIAGVVFGAPPMFTWSVYRALRFWRRIQAGRCMWCDYDCSAMPGDTCPECGRARRWPQTTPH